MNQESQPSHSKDHSLPHPILRRMRWPFPWIWLVPVLAAVGAAFYFIKAHEQRGPEIVVVLSDASGIRPGDTKATHRGVEIGTVESVQLGDDPQHVNVHIRLARFADDYAKEGAAYWVIRPRISIESVSGLSTVLTGPYFEASPGQGKIQKQFTALAREPLPNQLGIHLLLHTPMLEHLQVNSPVYYRGIQVGEVRDVGLSKDASMVDVRIFVQQHYAPIVRRNSRFWVVSSADVKGGIFSGVELKLGSLRTLISGGVAFATPEDPVGDLAQDGDEFPLYPESKKDWLEWRPRISLPASSPDNSSAEDSNPSSHK